MEGVMTYAQSFFGWLLQTTLIASVVICLILLIQKMLGGKLGPRWCHALWLVLLIRMILPWAPSSRVSLLNLIPSWDRQIQRAQPSEATEQQLPSHAGQASDTAEAIPAQRPEPDVAIEKQATPKPATLANIQKESKPRLASLRRVLPVLWLAGAIVIGAYLLVSNFALWRIVKRDSPLVKQAMLELFEECKAQMGVQSLVVVVPSSQIRSPALFGFIRPRLLLPSEMLEKASHEEMRYVFLHELAHLKRRDIYLGWLTSLLQVLHWFNPLVWFAFYRMRADRELACDALVLARTQKEESQEYGQAIVSLVRRFSRSRPLPAMAGIVENRSQLKRRIAMITQFKKNSYQWSPLSVILMIILACVSLPDARHTKASAVSAAKPPGMVVRRVWAGAADPYFMGAPSPDGKYLSYVDWETGDLAVYELATGKNCRLTNEGWEKGFASNSIFSPDGKQVAYYWFNYEEGAEQGPELRIVGLDGFGPRVIRLNKGRFVEMPAGWSADGKHILALGGTEDKSSQILLIPVEDGDLRVLKTLPKLPLGRYPAVRRKVGMSLSPDGRNVAYSFPSEKDSPKCDIFLLATDGSGEIALVEHPADDFVLAWAPDGKQVVFASDRTGSMGIWAVEVADGKTQGDPQLLKSEIGRLYPLGLTRNGSYYYGVFSGGCNIYVAPFDPQEGNIAGEPALTIQRHWGSNWAPAWSPDGRYLACVSSSPDAGPERRFAAPYYFLIRSMETGEVRELSPELTDFDVHSLSWFPDGRSLLGAGKTKKDVRPGILKIDVETGNATTIGTRGGRSPNTAPDGKAIFDVHGGRNGWGIYRHDLTTGEKELVFRAAVGEHGVGAILGLALSPDGKQLAFQDHSADKLKVLSVAGGQPRELVKFEGKATIAWTPDGSHLLYANWLGESPAELWRIPVEGGEPRKVDLEMAYLDHIRFHPNGRQITFTGKAEGDKIEVWVMENFLPEDMGK